MQGVELVPFWGAQIKGWGALNQLFPPIGGLKRLLTGLVSPWVAFFYPLYQGAERRLALGKKWFYFALYGGFSGIRSLQLEVALRLVLDKPFFWSKIFGRTSPLNL